MACDTAGRSRGGCGATDTGGPKISAPLVYVRWVQFLFVVVVVAFLSKTL